MNSRFSKFYEMKGIMPREAPVMVNIPDPVQEVIIEVPKKKKQIDIEDLDVDDIIDYIINYKPSTTKARQALKKFVYDN
jgi:hypothetical protein